jgi:hypothetical protein
LDKVTTKDSPGGKKSILCERVAFAYVSEGKHQEIASYFQEVMDNIDKSPECKEMKLTLAESQRVTENVVDELTIIRLRRTIPGQCKYCPV